MQRRFPLALRAIAYALRGGFLIRPFIIAIVLGAAGGVLSAAEETLPSLSAWVPVTLFPSRKDPQVAQIILGAIATAILAILGITIYKLFFS